MVVAAASSWLLDLDSISFGNGAPVVVPTQEVIEEQEEEEEEEEVCIEAPRCGLCTSVTIEAADAHRLEWCRSGRAREFEEAGEALSEWAAASRWWEWRQSGDEEEDEEEVQERCETLRAAHSRWRANHSATFYVLCGPVAIVWTTRPLALLAGFVSADDKDLLRAAGVEFADTDCLVVRGLVGCHALLNALLNEPLSFMQRRKKKQKRKRKVSVKKDDDEEEDEDVPAALRVVANGPFANGTLKCLELTFFRQITKPRSMETAHRVVLRGCIFPQSAARLRRAANTLLGLPGEDEAGESLLLRAEACFRRDRTTAAFEDALLQEDAIMITNDERQ